MKTTGDRADDRGALSRRHFLKSGVAAGVAVATGSASAATPAEGDGTPAKGDGDPAGRPAFDLEEATFGDLQAAMQSGARTARSLVQAYITRIEQLDRRGPALNQVLEINPDALGLADELDAERGAGRIRGPLHGIPILLKDNIGTADRMTTTAGSLALEGLIAPRDAFLVARLREAGAILLGKANLSEWANFRSSQSSSGWSGRGGQGKNPYALDRSPCGSSSGSGAATAANFCAAAVGTETDGSVVCPSSINSLVGIKPTLGLISRAGIIPLAHSQDTAGPMARTVTDAALLLGAMVGEDARDPVTRDSNGHAHTDYTGFLKKDGLRGARIGVAREQFFGYSPEADAIAEEAIAAVKDAGATVIDPANIPHAGDYGDSEFEVLLYEFKADLNAYLADLGDKAPAKSLAELIRFNEENADREMPFFGQELFHRAESKGPLTDQAYKDALAKNRKLSRTDGLEAVLAEHRLDAVMAPSNSPAWPIDLINGDHYLGSSSSPAAVSGCAGITVPAGYSYGLPVGITFIGGAFSEPTLIRLAYAFEQATRVRRPPTFRRWASW